MLLINNNIFLFSFKKTSMDFGDFNFLLKKSQKGRYFLDNSMQILKSNGNIVLAAHCAVTLKTEKVGRYLHTYQI